MATEVEFVAIKPPPFLETAATAWFAILEAQFHLRKITSEETRFYHALAALPPEIITRISEEQISSRTYSTLKDAVVSAHERTKPELFKKLTSTTQLTRRSSLLPQEILETANKVSAQLVRQLFVQAIPSPIAPVITAQKKLRINSYP